MPGRMDKKKYSVFCILLFNWICLFAQDLSIHKNDIEITQSIDGGYHLYIKKREGMASVLITSATADPRKKKAVYALRDPVFHPENGNERRILNKKFLSVKEKNFFSLIDSTPEPHPRFGKAFHIFIPYIVEYGYRPHTYDQLQVLDGTYLNIRSFSLPYGDYDGAFKDNPFVLRVRQKSRSNSAENSFMAEAVRSYSEIASMTAAKSIKSDGERDILTKIASILDEKEGDKSLDIVIVLDTTKSMENDFPFIQKMLVPLLKKYTASIKDLRFGMVFYKDYMEEYLTKKTGFFSDIERVQKFLDSISIKGGRDLPEAVYEALYSAITDFVWKGENRIIILIGDAPPHPMARQNIGKKIVFKKAGEKNIEINTIILPQ